MTVPQLPAHAPSLRTPRLLLRQAQLSDAPEMQARFPQWKVVRYLTASVPWPYPKDGAHTFLTFALKEQQKGHRLVWAITKAHAPQTLIGLVEYLPQPSHVGNRGFWIDPMFWGQGLMTEVTHAFQDYVFFELGVPALVFSNAKGNHASRRLKERAGARPLPPVEVLHHDGTTSLERWELTAEQWAARRQAP